MNILSSMTVVFTFLALSGCGSSATSACAKAEECATKAGTAFSSTECETQVTTAREKADSVKCGAEFDDAASCVSDLACGASIKEVDANCGAPRKTLNTCMKESTGAGSGTASVGGGDDCTLASEAIVAKLSTCAEYDPAQSGPGGPVECTAALGAMALCQSACVQAVSCGCLGLDSSQQCTPDESSLVQSCLHTCG